MPPLTAGSLRFLCIHRRRCSNAFFFFGSLLLLVYSSLSGSLEESLSRLLPIIYPGASPALSSPLSGVSLPPFLLSPANACSSPPLLLILVSSAPSHRDRRDAIRQTWGSLSSATASSSLTLFVLGVPAKAEERSALVHEAVTHGDIIQANFTDTYRNLTLKTLTGLVWAAQKCQGARFLLKTDDDVFVNTLALSDFLKNKRGLQYLGRVHWHVAATRDPNNRHYTSHRLYTRDHFPPYCSGTGYVLSLEAAVRLLQQAGDGPWIPLEDACVGILAKAAGIAPKHVAKMAGSTAVPHNSCCYRNMLTSHGLTPHGMQEAWNMLKEDHWCPPFTGLFCKLFGKPVENGSS